MKYAAIQKALRQNVAAAKVALRDGEATVTDLTCALDIELAKYAPRQRLVAWICKRIPTLPLKPKATIE